jgi:hypothetical protein
MVAESGDAIPKALRKKIETEFDSIIRPMKYQYEKILDRSVVVSLSE